MSEEVGNTSEEVSGSGDTTGNDGKFLHPTPHLDNLESGEWPSFITGFKKLAERTENTMVRGVMDQLEYSYDTKMGYWKGGLVTVKGYGAGIITRYSLIQDKYPEAKEFHTMRFQPPAGMHYSTENLRKVCDVWEKYGSGIMALHGQSGDLMLQGIPEANVQECFDEMNKIGWDLGGAGATMRTSMSCVGPARCDDTCYDTLNVHDKMLKYFTGYVHRPEFPYKTKFKFSGCPNDCVNAVMRSDFAVIGTWRDDIKVDEAGVKQWIAEHGVDAVVNEVIALCPTKAISLKGTDALEIDNKSCVRCMHCINVMNPALAIGDDRGISLLIGGKNHLKVGAMLGSLVVPFMKVGTEDELQEFMDMCEGIIEWWDDNAFDHERIGETIERVGMKQFLSDLDIDANPNMVTQPRNNPYFKTAY